MIPPHPAPRPTLWKAAGRRAVCRPCLPARGSQGAVAVLGRSRRRACELDHISPRQQNWPRCRAAARGYRDKAAAGCQEGCSAAASTNVHPRRQTVRYDAKHHERQALERASAGGSGGIRARRSRCGTTCTLTIPAGRAVPSRRPVPPQELHCGSRCSRVQGCGARAGAAAVLPARAVCGGGSGRRPAQSTAG